jgi:hypothetical protein
MALILSYIFKNLAIIIGVIEAILKAVAAIVSITPTKRDDVIYAAVDSVFSKIKQILYNISDKLGGKDPVIPNS